jgi:hypothetical protein
MGPLPHFLKGRSAFFLPNCCVASRVAEAFLKKPQKCATQGGGHKAKKEKAKKKSFSHAGAPS